LLLAAAAGFADGLGRGTTLVVGDISFLHDINGLNLLRSGERWWWREGSRGSTNSPPDSTGCKALNGCRGRCVAAWVLCCVDSCACQELLVQQLLLILLPAACACCLCLCMQGRRGRR
jgi:hypothetical protein